ncbi:probable disease resistance protein At4g27220 [Durio zibethinus]|uniref:Probable disease resistance protein At4g27220 n=1 Tax=Durio zibethinus TaxID=66656 RepID=A0A6P5X862_DURZI|nr:probable disease resistance protein At4g27220 [Durio zibethinus]
MEAIATGAAANLSSDAAKGIFQEIRRHIRYVIIYKKNVEKFEEKMKMLLAKRESVQKDIEAAERNVEKIKPDVELWCSNVDKVFEEAKSVKDLQDKAKSKCFIGLCPNIKSRYQLSRKAEEVVAAFNEHLQQGEFNSVSCPAPPPDIVDATPKDFEAFESRAKVFKDIMEALKDGTTNLIGVYGMAGVGKTTLVKEVYRQAKEDKLFDSVTMAFVNQSTPDLQKVQDQLAASLGLKLEGKDVVVRAARLRERLKKEKKVLVILDDIWKKLDLNDVGIPFGDENKGCNILLTSRDLNVLRNEMDARKNFAISVLEDKEAWDLFKKMAGDDAESPELRSTAIEVAKKCAGLPVAIATVARALRNKGLFAWNDALRKLQRPSPTNFKGIPAHVYSAIELSYHHLEREELKQTFVLCALLGHNAFIRDLLRYTIGLGLFHGVNGVEETRDRLLTVVSELKSSCLLRDSYTNVRVDMHDLICDVALAIAYRDYNVFALKDEDDLEDWPNGETMEKCTMISLRYANISYFPKELKCPKLDLFLLYNEDHSVELPINFFKETLNLKVLDLTDMQFQSLPSSISLLTNLRTLCLDLCNLGDIAGVGELKNLEILSLFGSYIEMLPKEIGELIKLRLLDLSDCTRLKIIPAGVISSLSRLEELYMGNSFVQWEVERQANQQSNASLAELKLLSRLTTLDVHIPDAKIMPADLFCKKLERYKIFIGKEWDWVGECKHSRTLKLKLNTSVDELDHGFKMFLKKTEDLYLDDMKGVKIALHELMDEEGFQPLKNLHIQNGSEIEYIISDDGAAYKNEFLQLRSLTLHGLPRLISFCFENGRGSNSSCQNQLPLFSEKLAFPCLESLRLSSINVERIWHNRFSNVSDYGTQNLTSLTIEGCDNLKQLLSSSMARSLTHLECFEIVGCKCLREVIFAEDIEEENKATISFPQLNSLKIKKLQHLIGFCSESYNVEFPSLKLLEIEQCPRLRGFIHKSTVEDNQHFSPQALFDVKVAFPSLKQLNISWLRNMKMIWHNELSVNSFCKLEKMAVVDCNELFTIFPFDLLTTFQQLQTLQVSSCGSMEHIFELQRLNVNETHVVATQLRELYVSNLPKLKNVWNEDPQGILTFQNLKEVEVRKCWSLKNVFPASVARVLPQLKDLTVDGCAVGEIVSKAKGWETSVTNFNFDQVSSLQLWNLPKLECFYPGMHTTKWPMLKKLKTMHCNKLKILDIGCLNLPDMSEDDQLDSPIQPPLFLVEKVVPKLEEMSLTSDDIAIICDSNVPEGLFHEIKVLYLLCYHDISAIFPTTFLERFKNLEKLEICCCNFNDLFSYERGVGKGTNALTLSPFRNLRLFGLHRLKHMWMQGSRLDYILPNLETIEVFQCDNMISLGLSSTPFQNLMTLNVWECGAMINLVTSLAVQSLVQLKNLRIKNCLSMKEIVGNERDDEATTDIIFNRLECLELRHLPSLKSFCSGDHTFGFPSLDQVIVSHCPELEIFCKGDLNTPILQRVQVIRGEDEQVHWDGDLNITVQQLYTKKGNYEGIECLVLSDTSKAIQIWRDNLQKSLNLKNLKLLEVCGCNSLKYIFTTSMAFDLLHLKVMKVRNCVMMEQIIINDGAEKATTNTIMFPSLESIILESCSNLRSFYLGHDTVEYPSLTILKVEDCPKMVAFTTSSPREQNIKTIGIAPFFSDKVSFVYTYGSLHSK